MTIYIYRQGDVTLKTRPLPKGAKEISRGKENAVALGEATGHHHTLYGSHPGAIIEYEGDGRRFVELDEQLNFWHNQHDEFKVKPSLYEITIEREHDYFEKKIKQVRD